jgi:hypothetical protein
MTDTAAVGTQVAGEREVVGAVDAIDGVDHLVIADVTCDGAWLAMATTDAVSTVEHR